MIGRSTLALLSLVVLGISGASARAADTPWAVPTAGVSEQAIALQNRGARLSGTLYYPAGGRALGTVIVLHGAGAPLRSEPLYAHLKTMLPALGMAVFVYDRHGSGGSQNGGADPGDFDLLAADAVAAFGALSRNPVVDPRRMGFWGLSQGGWLTLLAAAKEPRAAFAVAASAPMAAADAQMNFAVANILHINGYPKSVVDAAIAARTAVDDFTRGKRSRAEAEAAEAAIRDKPWYKMT